ncbi:hypothetical protein BGZ67_006796 [Mortierella alpina]|nr:hypothetical protein BGZ67_006796 [Mortierella alpina]
MAPTKKTTSPTKRASSPIASAEPANKRGRKSETHTEATTDTAEEGFDDADVKQEDAVNTKQATKDDSTASKRTTRSHASPKTKAAEEIEDKNHEEKESKIKEEDVKAEPKDSVKKESKEASTSEPRTLEKGHVFFFYRPKIDVHKPQGPNDVQKLYMLLCPDDAAGRPAAEDKIGELDSSSKPSHSGKPQHRLLILPRKLLPVPGNGAKSRVWAFVDKASPDLDEVESRLERYTYSTKTRGERTQQSARLIGEARYEIILDDNHSHFVYALAVPQEPGEVQKSFNIAKEGQFLVQVKNPEIQTPATERGEARYATLGKSAAKLPKHLQEKFRGIRKDWVRYAPLDTGEFLDISHVELGFFAVNKGAKDEFAEAVELMEQEIDEELSDREGDVKEEEKVYKELDLEPSEVPAAVEEFQ